MDEKRTIKKHPGINFDKPSLIRRKAVAEHDAKMSETIRKNYQDRIEKDRKLESLIRQKAKERLEAKPEPVNRIERDDGIGRKPTKQDLLKEGKEIGKSGILEKKNALETTSDNINKAEKMVAIAKEKGWESIKLSGTDVFRGSVWAKAAEEGIKVDGYFPTEKEKKAVANKVLAKSFDKDPEKAIKSNPELKDSKSILDSIATKIKLDGLDKKQQAIVNDRARHNIAQAISLGNIPRIEKQAERELER